MTLPATTKKQHVALAAIEFDSATQVRAEINVATVAEYAERMEANDKFPPAVLFQDGEQFFIGDGWHRLLAAQKNNAVTFPCTVLRGGKIEAVKYALGANTDHGLKRTNADKDKAVRMALKNFPEWSDRQIASACVVGHQLVAKVRGQVDENPPERRLGADGKTYPASQPRRAQGAAAPAGVPTWDPASGEPKPSWVEDMEHFEATKNDVFELPSDATGAATTAATPVAPAVTTAQTLSAAKFDVAGWKANAEAVMRNWLGQVPENLRVKAAAWIGDTAKQIVEAAS